VSATCPTSGDPDRMFISVGSWQTSKLSLQIRTKIRNRSWQGVRLQSNPPVYIANTNRRYLVFQGEPSERDRRKRAVRFIDSWNHVSVSQRVEPNRLLSVQSVLLPTPTHEHRPRPRSQDFQRCQQQSSSLPPWLS